MTQVSPAMSGTRVVGGPGSAQVLSGAGIQQLMRERHFDSDWSSYLWQGQSLPQTSIATLGDDPVWDVDPGADGDLGFVAGTGGVRNALRLDTAATDGDQVILQAKAAGSILGEGFDTDREPYIYVNLGTSSRSAGIHNVRLFVGLKLTGTDVIVTDADQAMWHYDAASDTTAEVPWHTVTSVAGIDDDRTSGGIVRQNRSYKLGVFLDRARRPYYVVNDHIHHIGPAMTDLATIIPMIGVAARGAAAQKILFIQKMMVGQRFEART